MIANDNVKHPEFETCRDLCEALGDDTKFTSHVIRNVSRRQFESYFFFIKFEIEHRYREVLDRRHRIGVIQ